MIDDHRHRQKNVSGSVLVNGRPRDLRAFRHDSVYIMQSEVLLEQLSVSEALHYSAALKLPSSVRLLLLLILWLPSLSAFSRTRTVRNADAPVDVDVFDVCYDLLTCAIALCSTCAQMTAKEREARVDEILDIMKLTHARHTRSSNLSGGERRRLGAHQFHMQLQSQHQLNTTVRN